MLSVLTLGVLPLWWFVDRSGRRRRYEPLFRRGQLVRGSIAAVVPHGEGHFYATYKYAYTVGDVQFRGFIHDPDPLIRYFSEGDAGAVLHDSDDPTASCFGIAPLAAGDAHAPSCGREDDPPLAIVSPPLRGLAQRAASIVLCVHDSE